MAYINTDLDIEGTACLSDIVAFFEKNGMLTLHAGRTATQASRAHFETGEQLATPEASISAMLDVIERLDHATLAIWHSCSLREFNIGMEAGDTPRPSEYKLSTELLRRVVGSGAQIGLTIYAPDQS